MQQTKSLSPSSTLKKTNTRSPSFPRSIPNVVISPPSDSENNNVKKHINKLTSPNLHKSRENDPNLGLGLIKAVGSPKLSDKLAKNLHLNMNLSESIINSAAKAIEDSTVKLGDKDLHTELQLGELKLSTLDKKIDECLENSRKALSMNDICSQRANNILSPERRILLDSSTTSPYGRSSNGGSPLRNMSSLSLSVTKKPSDRSLKSLALTRETTQEESGAPVEIRQGGKLKSPETRIRTDGRISVRDLTGLDLSQRVQHNNIISGERNRVGRIMNPKLGAKTSNRYVSEENKTHNNNSAPETQSSPAGEERREIEIITNYEVLERPINEKGEDSLERKYGKVRGSSGESNDREYSEYLKPKSATHSFQSPKQKTQKTELGVSFTQKGFFLSPNKNNFSSPNLKGKNVGHLEARNFLSPNMKRTRPASNKSMDMQNYEKALRNPSQRGENTVINNKKEEQKGSHQNQRKEKRKNFSVAGTSDFKSKQDLRNLLSVDRNSQGKLIRRVNETSNVGKDYRGLHNSDIRICPETDETLLSQVQRSFHESSSIMRNSKGKRKSQDGRESIDAEPVEVHFTKAFSLVKNKIINQGATFEERMKSDLYFRRRFENDLSEFKRLLKPKISEEQASELYEKLIEDGKRRVLRAQQLEQEKEELVREQSRPFFDFNSIKSESDPEKVFERLINDSRERAKSREKLEMLKQERHDQEEREAMREFNQSQKKMDRASVQNLVSKLVKDAERRKYSAEKTQFLKEEEEERQLSASTSQFFTKRNNNNKAESKIKQYINKSLERTTNSREKLSKSSSKASLVREISPQKVRFTNERIANQTLIEHITSPNKSKRTKSARKGDFELACEKELKEMKEICMKEAWKSNLDYLRGLREDIERIKDNIEKKIEGIEQEEITIPTLNSPVKRTEQIKPIYIPGSHKPRSTRVSIEKIPDKPAKSRAKSRYLNSSTRMSDNMENRNEKQGRPSGPRKGSTGNYNLSRVETNNLANISRTLKGKDNMPSGNHQKGGGNVKEGTAKSNFMNDKKATSYVNQLIMDFKEIHNLRNAARK